MHDFPFDSLFGKRTKKTIFRLCFQTSQCPLCMDCLWIKATSLFGTAVLLTWSKGKASASGHYHYHFTIFLPACYMGFPLQIFFLSSTQTDSSFSCLGKSQQENAQDWWGREGSYIGSFLCLFSNSFSFLFEAVVISVVLVNTFLYL